jgi:aspartate racemase
MNKVIGIIGGMGPKAGLTLHKRILDNTITNGLDQDHLPIIHISFSSLISDRTNFILKKTDDNPKTGAIECIKILNNSIKNLNCEKIIVGIPCNTFHSNIIFKDFSNEVKRYENIILLNMVEEVKNYLLKKKIYNAGLLSTSGVYYSNLYDNILNENKINIHKVDDNNQKMIQEAIYNKEWGIKAKSNPVTKKAKKIIFSKIDYFQKKGVTNIILGCTEIPLIFNDYHINKYNINFINPVDILSKEMIKQYFNN